MPNDMTSIYGTANTARTQRAAQNYSLNLGQYYNHQNGGGRQELLGNSYINVGPPSSEDYCDCQAYSSIKNPDLICDPEPIYANTNGNFAGLKVITPPIYSVVNKKAKAAKNVEFAESTDSQTTTTTNSRNSSPESGDKMDNQSE